LLQPIYAPASSDPGSGYPEHFSDRQAGSTVFPSQKRQHGFIPGFVIISLSRDNKPALWIGINHRSFLPDFDTGIK